MSESTAKRTSLIEFPTTIAVKAMGLASEDFQSLVQGLIVEHAEAEPGTDAVSVRSSRGGKYVSVSVSITAESQAQLEAVYAALRAEPRVLFTL